jgi:hypothetical protein
LTSEQLEAHEDVILPLRQDKSQNGSFIGLELASVRWRVVPGLPGRGCRVFECPAAIDPDVVHNTSGARIALLFEANPPSGGSNEIN